jgi:cytochrome c oxidase assembly factor CtaG
MFAIDAIFSSWTWQPWLAGTLLFCSAIYVRGWLELRRRSTAHWHGYQPAAFLLGLGTIYFALASPIDTFAAFLLQVHMTQHLLLMMVAPPLVWLGSPFFPLLRGLPSEIRRYWIAPILRWRPLTRLAGAITHPVAALLVFIAANWLWHLPATYELALANSAWHHVQHFCFLAAGLVFWFPVVQPYPTRPTWSLWLLAPYLILADVQNTLLAAFLTFSDHVWYPFYLSMPRLGGVSALADQAAAGVLMWVPGSIVFLVPLGWIGVRLMTGVPAARRRADLQVTRARERFDLLKVPGIGHALRSVRVQRVVQFVALLIVAAVIVDGFRGPQVAAMNLAGVVPWIHWRGLLILALLFFGNLFCFGCPFILPRTILRRWIAPRIEWPRWLRTKWLAVALLGTFLWAYEAMALWNSPWITAWIAVGYFGAATVIDCIFKGASFCKYVCPIGQFNFVQSLTSPLEVRVREPEICTSCRSHDCIRGSESAGVPVASGCQLQLFQPRKAGNLDCTFCLDCVRACPHDNVGVLAAAPATTLWRDGPRSGIGRLTNRLDLAVLALLLVFGAFVNAAGMVAPVVELERQLRWLGVAASSIFYLVFLVVVPLIALIAVGLASRSLVGNAESLRRHLCRFAWALVPLGFAMWLAHYSFHFFTSYDAIVPVAQRFATDWGLASFGSSNWVCTCCQAAPGWLLHGEILALDCGLLVSLYVAWRNSLSLTGSRGRAMSVALPWAALIVALYAIGVWILFQPMEMRGTLGG